MMKFHGKDYPVSHFKFFLHDITADQLEWIRTYLKLKNNAQTISHIIWSVHKQLKDLDDYLKTNGDSLEGKNDESI